MIRSLVGPIPDAPDAVALLGALGAGGPAATPLRTGDDRAVAYLGAVSHALLHGPGRRHPELVALASFLRPAAARRLLAERAAATSADVRRVPRGLVFHVPPANVDTIFVYSWALSLLAGNANVVRLSERTVGPAAAVLLDALRAAAAIDPAVATTQAFVTYGHDDAVTAELSAACALRMLWGGDAAVTRLRTAPLAPGARELTFPDRFSLAAIGPGYLALDDAGRDAVAVGLYNDAYWFDQAACASPRLLAFVADPSGAARADLWARLGAVVAARHPGLDVGAAVDKRVAVADLALAGAAARVDWTSNELVAAELRPDAGVCRTFLGPGTFQMVGVPTLRDLAPLVEPRDQTLVHAGLTAEDLDELVAALNGRGVDRMVPVGRALTFGPLWDGEDLFEQLTRRVQVVPAPARRLN